MSTALGTPYMVEVHCDRNRLPVVWEHTPDGVRFYECQPRKSAQRLAGMLCEVHNGLGRECTLIGGES